MLTAFGCFGNFEWRFAPLWLLDGKNPISLLLLLLLLFSACEKETMSDP